MTAVVCTSESWRKTRRIMDVETIWESLDLGFAADDTALKLRIEERPDFFCCVARCTTLVFLSKHFNYFAYIWPNFVILRNEVCRIVNQNS